MKLPPLTSKQLEYLRELCAGTQRKNLPAKLGVSDTALKRRRRVLLRKFLVTDTIALAVAFTRAEALQQLAAARVPKRAPSPKHSRRRKSR